MAMQGGLFGWVGLLAVTLLSAPLSAPLGAQQAVITGSLSILERGGKRGTDVGQAVLWLEGGRAGAPRAARVDIVTEGKQFSPHVLVVPAGATVAFPNHDPFNHNVFSVSEAGPFDLGLYGRGETKSIELLRPGVVRIYCNIHARMSAIVVVRNELHVAQPGADGGFTFSGVPPGSYILKAWHERGGELSLRVEVPAAGMTGLRLQLDASKFKYTPHLNKFHRPYDDEGREY